MTQPTEDFTALLTRLSQKPGVRSTLVLSRQNGAILQTSGLISKSVEPSADGTTSASQDPAATSENGQHVAGAAEDTVGQDPRERSGLRIAEDVARVVWQFFEKSGELVNELMGTEDEVRLLRLRMRKNELFIYPEPKFILIVIHDTPSA